MYKKNDSINTYLGILTVGDKIKLSWTPSGIPKDKDGNLIVYAIWATDSGEIALGLNKKGIRSYNYCYRWEMGETIIGKKSLLELIPNKINWKKTLGG